MSNNLLKSFVIGSSLPATAITFLYMGRGFHKSGHTGVDHYEIIPFLIPTILGTLNMASIWAQTTYQVSPLLSQSLAGVGAGLVLSTIGHEVLDLPTRIFNISLEKQQYVHIGAALMYATIYAVVINYLNKAVL